MHVEGVPWEGVMGAITFGFYLKQFFFFFSLHPPLNRTGKSKLSR